MNSRKRQNEFRDIPGFGATKGERIVKELQKIWQKLQYLQQCRVSEKKSTSEASCSAKEEDMTSIDVQFYLALVQSRYVRSLLKKKFRLDTEPSQRTISNGDQIYASTAADENIGKEDELPPSFVNTPASAEIYTEDNSTPGLSFPKESSSAEDVSKNIQVISENQLPKFSPQGEESSAVHQRRAPSSKPHYHLKLDDVPFLLAASTGASHSVIANTQNIIAQMKQHNKVLCGPKPNSTRSTSTSAYPTVPEKLKSNVRKSTFATTHSTDTIENNAAGENSKDVTKLINDLTSDLCELAAKQKKLVERKWFIDASQIEKYVPEINSARNVQNDEAQINYKDVEKDGFRAYRSNSESKVKLRAEVKKMQPSNRSIVERRKLLRSLQKFKKHLSEEDISWD